MTHTHSKSGPLHRIQSMLSRFCYENPCNKYNIPEDVDENIAQSEININLDFANHCDQNVTQQTKIPHQPKRKNSPQNTKQINKLNKPIHKAQSKINKNVSKKTTFKSKQIAQQVLVKDLKESSTTSTSASPIIIEKDHDIDKIVHQCKKIQPDLETSSEDVENQNFLSAMKKMTDEKIKVCMKLLLH